MLLHISQLNNAKNVWKKIMRKCANIIKKQQLVSAGECLYNVGRLLNFLFPFLMTTPYLCAKF